MTQNKLILNEDLSHNNLQKKLLFKRNTACTQNYICAYFLYKYTLYSTYINLLSLPQPLLSLPKPLLEYVGAPTPDQSAPTPVRVCPKPCSVRPNPCSVWPNPC